MDEMKNGRDSHGEHQGDACGCGFPHAMPPRRPKSGCESGQAHEEHQPKNDDACGCGKPNGEHHHGHHHEHHGDACGCGQAHEEHHHGHHHDDACGCGQAHEEHHHGHHHEHLGGCGCGCGHSHGDHDGPDYDNGLTIAENNVLMALWERGALPVCRFTLSSSSEPEAYAVALEPVYIANLSDSLEQIREYGSLFSGMEDKDLIALDYEEPIEDYPYPEYRASDAFRHFVETAAEAKTRGFTFDTPNLELGSITLAERGRKTLDRMLGR